MKTNASGTAESVFAPGAKLEKLAGGFDFTEGPTCNAAGNVFFTDQPNDRILKWGVEGELSTFLQPAGRANGLCFNPRGHLIACADEKNALWSIAPDGKVTVLVSEYRGKLLNGPNDVWVRAGRRALLHRPVLRSALVDPPHDAAGRPACLLRVRRPPAPRARGR